MKHPKLVHREATPADRDLMLPLIRAYYAHDHIPFRARQMRTGLGKFLADPSLGRAFVLEVSGATAGYALVTWGFDLELGGRLALLTDLFLLPEQRRHGFGQATLRFLAARCRALGAHSLELQVERHNRPARGLYEGFGFRALDRIPMSKALR